MSSDRQAYHRLETDEEFRARIGYDVLTVRRSVQLTGWYGAKYTDTVEEHHRIKYLKGEELDDIVWQALKMQRRIIFVPAP